MGNCQMFLDGRKGDRRSDRLESRATRCEWDYLIIFPPGPRKTRTAGELMGGNSVLDHPPDPRQYRTLAALDTGLLCVIVNEIVCSSPPPGQKNPGSLKPFNQNPHACQTVNSTRPIWGQTGFASLWPSIQLQGFPDDLSPRDSLLGHFIRNLERSFFFLRDLLLPPKKKQEFDRRCRHVVIRCAPPSPPTPTRAVLISRLRFPYTKSTNP
jgi:hypothetical protein